MPSLANYPHIRDVGREMGIELCSPYSEKDTDAKVDAMLGDPTLHGLTWADWDKVEAWMATLNGQQKVMLSGLDAGSAVIHATADDVDLAICAVDYLCEAVQS